ncbi:hypothetical protein [Streptacidiphilus albus]|uniref:hypothetical protein n=1 Tax=Streptacidiphilus albus TaxID=105425 RepID=UPI0005A73CB3|nr:hypothetical protein [Streptacidiphilus albus]
MTIPTSGQRRINAKRARQAAYWDARRTVKVLVGGELIPYLDRIVQLLGDGAQLHHSTPRVHSWVTDLDVHIPGAPPDAHRAEPHFRNVWTGERYGAELASIDWFDATGRSLATPAQPPPASCSPRCSPESTLAGHTYDADCVLAAADGWIVDLQRGNCTPYQRAGLKRPKKRNKK